MNFEEAGAGDQLRPSPDREASPGDQTISSAISFRVFKFVRMCNQIYVECVYIDAHICVLVIKSGLNKVGGLQP